MSDRRTPRALWTAVLGALLLAGCAGSPKILPPAATSKAQTSAPAVKTKDSTVPQLPKANSGRGGYYQDDGPGENPPPDLESTVEPIPVVEAFARRGNKPYVVFGKTYTPITDSTTPLKQRGVASWYGKKFHGQKTSSGEPYDMYKITAAHPTLPIPSYARVSNLENGKQIIVRINDRGPFHSSRILDLSYTAALKLGYLGKGSSQIEVERLLPEDIEKMAENRKNQDTPATLAGSPTLANAGGAPAPMTQALPNALEAWLAAQENQALEKIDSKTASSAPGFYIQFGAYAIRANAQASMSRFKQNLEKRLPDFDIVQQGNLYRLISGPFASRAEAINSIAQNADLGLAKALVVQR